MDEGNKLPAIDNHGHSVAGIAGTEQGDRISIAMANILLKSQVNQRDAASSVEKSVMSFKSDVEEKLKISSQGYDIIFKEGKATVVGKILSAGKSTGADNLKKIQNLLDSPSGNNAVKLLSDIDQYNQLSWQLIDHELTQHIYGAEHDRYLQKKVTVDWLMNETNYSNVYVGNGLYDKYVEIVAAANVKYHAALEDGSHFVDGKTDPGIYELTKIREAINTHA